MIPTICLQRITDAAFDNGKLHAWCAFSDINAPNTPPIGEFHQRGLPITCPLPAKAGTQFLYPTGTTTKIGPLPTQGKEFLRFSEAPQNNLPLQNLTVGVKDIIDVAGLPTRCGSAIYENVPPVVVDAACVALMRSAGAVIVGKTVTTELATFVPAATRNPVNPAHTPGGSSAGSASAVAAGHVDIAIGTQTAGSILRPAAYCGVFGFKPSFGVVPRTGVKVQSEALDTVGVFARNIELCEAWLAAMTGEPLAKMHAAPRKLRIACVTTLMEHATADMQAAITRAKHALAAAGHEVLDWALPEALATIHDQQKIIQHHEAARAYHAERSQHRALLTPMLANVLDEGAAIPRSTYLQAIHRAEQARSLADGLFENWDVWLMPAAPGSAPHGLSSTGDPIFNRLASVLHTPAISVPVFSDKGGMPLGLQLVGGRGGDVALLGNTQTISKVLIA